MPRTRSRRDEIAALLARREREGLTYEELAAISGLKRSTLSWWAWRLRSEGHELSPFAAVVIVDEDEVVDPECRQGVQIRRGRLAIDVAPDIDARTLRRVLEVMADAPC